MSSTSLFTFEGVRLVGPSYALKTEFEAKALLSVVGARSSTDLESILKSEAASTFLCDRDSVEIKTFNKTPEGILFTCQCPPVAKFQPRTLEVQSTPEQLLVPGNLVFCNEADWKDTSFKTAVYVNMEGYIFTMCCHPGVQAGRIALNSIHREMLRCSQGETVTVFQIHPPGSQNGIVRLVLEVDMIMRNRVIREPLDATKMSEFVRRVYKRQMFRVDQKFVMEFSGITLIAKVLGLETLKGLEETHGNEPLFGMLVEDSLVEINKHPRASFNLVNQNSGIRPLRIEFSFEKLGIGGLDHELAATFRRAFASRMYPPETIRKLGIKHVKGILLYGPPGTGKTLIARQIGKMLKTKDPKVVNGPELLNKYVGATEEAIRELFADAEEDAAANGEDAELHLIIFDEIDAICKKRGSVRDGTGVIDSAVNQLLSKMDGVDEMNNVLVIGMTNRKDMMDDALLRHGRFEVHMEVGLPDEAGRLQILRIHTSQMKKEHCLNSDVDLENIASRTRNFSGAEIAGLIRSAASFALNRKVDLENTDKVPEGDVVVEMSDFEEALLEVQPQFGVSAEEISMYLGAGLIPYGPTFDHLVQSCSAFVKQVEKGTRANLLTVLLEGPLGSGKTALAAHLAMESKFPFVKFVTPESMVGFAEGSKCSTIAKLFDDAYKSPLSVIVLDNIERLVEYVHIGPRFSNAVLQTLLVLLKKRPPKGRRLLILGTTSCKDILEPMEIVDSFNVVMNVPALHDKSDIRRVLESSNSFAPEDIDGVTSIVPGGVGIKQLLLIIEMAQAELLEEESETSREEERGPSTSGEASSSSSSSRRTVSYDRFLQCLLDFGLIPDLPDYL